MLRGLILWFIWLVLHLQVSASHMLLHFQFNSLLKSQKSSVEGRGQAGDWRGQSIGILQLHRRPRKGFQLLIWNELSFSHCDLFGDFSPLYKFTFLINIKKSFKKRRNINSQIYQLLDQNSIFSFRTKFSACFLPKESLQQNTHLYSFMFLGFTYLGLLANQSPELYVPHIQGMN